MLSMREGCSVFVFSKKLDSVGVLLTFITIVECERLIPNGVTRVQVEKLEKKL